MASGNSLCYWSPYSAILPATAYAQLDAIVGAATPAETVPVLAFDASTIEYADFRGRLPANYSGGGLTLSIANGAAVSSNAVVWGAAFRRINDDAEDLDTTAHSYDYNDATVTVPSAIGEVGYDNITFTSGSDMDSLAAGEEFILRIRRNASSGSDTASGDAYLHGLELKET